MASTLDELIASADRGDRAAADELFDMLYSKLHRLARRELSRQGAVTGLGVTTLLHEAYLAISSREATAIFPDHARFMAYAARVMRGLIIDDARRRHTQKRGGQIAITSLESDQAERITDARNLVRIGDALDELATFDAAVAEIVDLKFFCGFSFAEIAAMRGVSERTVQRSWEKGRIYLHRAIVHSRPSA
jgi:RNA polymerase sigma factor (TIGR02999 family)